MIERIGNTYNKIAQSTIYKGLFNLALIVGIMNGIIAIGCMCGGFISIINIFGIIALSCVFILFFLPAVLTLIVYIIKLIGWGIIFIFLIIGFMLLGLFYLFANIVSFVTDDTI